MPLDSVQLVPVPAVDDLHATGAEIEQKSREYRITTDAEQDLAGEFLRRIVRYKDDVVERFRTAKDLAHKAHRAICEAEKTELAPAIAAETKVRRALSDFATEQERVRRVAQARLQQEQRERDEKARQAEAEALDKAGDTEAAVALLEAPVPTVAVQVDVHKTEGLSFRDEWKWEVVDESKVDRAFCSPDPKLIGPIVKGLKDRAASKVGGIRVWFEKVPAARR